MNKIRAIVLVMITNVIITVLLPIAAIADAVTNIVHGRSMKGIFIYIRNELSDIHKDQIELIANS